MQEYQRMIICSVMGLVLVVGLSSCSNTTNATESIPEHIESIVSSELDEQITPIPSPIPTEFPKKLDNASYNIEYIDAGVFYLTHYCAGSCCCGEYANGYTANGSRVSDSMIGHTVATDTSILPFGTRFIIPELYGYEVFEAQDRGSLVTGNHIDIYEPSHEQALNYSEYGYYHIYIIGG